MEYCFTLKYIQTRKAQENGFTNLPSFYEDGILSEWRKQGIEINKVRYEKDTKGVCHAHGVITASKDLKFKSLKKKGFSQYIEKKEGDAWDFYINKDQDCVSEYIPEDYIDIKKLPRLF